MSRASTKHTARLIAGAAHHLAVAATRSKGEGSTMTSSAPLDGINDEIERPDTMIMNTETSPAINNGWRVLVVSVLEAERKIRL
jgi:hypothetical protein